MNLPLNYSNFTEFKPKKKKVQNKIKNLFKKIPKHKELKLNYDNDDEEELADFNEEKNLITDEQFFKNQENEYENNNNNNNNNNKKTPHDFEIPEPLPNPELTHNNMDKSPYSLLLSNNQEEINYVKENINNNNYNNNNNDNLMEKLNYMIHLLEEQKEEKTEYVTEEIILYLFLGVFVVFVIDSFVKVGKYTR